MSRYTSDQSLAEGLQAGRRDAFERLYADQHAGIYNLCARILGDRQEAEDVTHDTFITAFSSPPEATGQVKLRPWLYRVATNACFNRLRSRKHVSGGEAVATLPDRVDEYQRAETAALVEASLAALNARYRTALVLKDLHGLPPAEIAEVMDVSRPTADVLVHRARRAFKAAFARLGGSTPAPANLGLVLAPLPVPAALHAFPPLPHVAVPPHALPHPGVPSAAGPAGVGLLTKIGAALTTKVVIGAAAATVVIGGGIVALHDAKRHHGADDAAAAVTRPAAKAQGAGAILVSRPVHLLKTRWGCLEWSTPHDLRDVEKWCADHVAAECSEASHDAAEDVGHDAHEVAGHAGGEQANTGTGGSHTGDDAGAGSEASGDSASATTSHDSTASHNSTSHDSGGDSSTHDSGDGSHE
jgi:RNA polymerase sigma-70 factor, ECF subfamily